MKLYNEEKVLGIDEYVFKISGGVGFLTKLTLKGELPKNFVSWKTHNIFDKRDGIFLHTETFREGWKIIGSRIGKSQQWARVKMPEGFIIEIYLDDFLQKLASGYFNVKNGEIIGELKWKDNTLASIII